MDSFGEELAEIESPDGYLLDDNDIDDIVCDDDDKQHHNDSIISDFVKSIKDKKQELENLIISLDKISVETYFKQLTEIEISVAEIKESIKMTTIYDENYNEVPLSKVFIITSNLEELVNKITETNSINARVLKTKNHFSNPKFDKETKYHDKQFLNAAFGKETKPSQQIIDKFISNKNNQSYYTTDSHTNNTKSDLEKANDMEQERIMLSSKSEADEKFFIDSLSQIVVELVQVKNLVKIAKKNMKDVTPFEVPPSQISDEFNNIQTKCIMLIDDINSQMFIGLKFTIPMIDRAKISELILKIKKICESITKKLQEIMGNLIAKREDAINIDVSNDAKIINAYEELNKIYNNFKTIFGNLQSVEEKELLNHFEFVKSKCEILSEELVANKIFDKTLNKFICLAEVPHIKTKIDDIKEVYASLATLLDKQTIEKPIDKTIILYDYYQKLVDMLGNIEKMELEKYKNVTEMYNLYKKNINIENNASVINMIDGICKTIDNVITSKKLLVLTVVENNEKKLQENKKAVIATGSTDKNKLYTIHCTVALDKLSFDKYLNTLDPYLLPIIQEQIDNYNSEFLIINKLIDENLNPSKGSKYKTEISKMFSR